MLYRVLWVGLLLGAVGCSDNSSTEVQVKVQEQPVTENTEHFIQEQLKALKDAKSIEQLLQNADAEKRRQVEAMTQ